MLLSLLWSSYLIASAMALSYAPIYVPCPDNLIRYGNDGLSPHESAYISQRKNKAGLNLLSWIQKLNLTGFDAMEFFANPSNVPTLALAFSGGGYRAMLNGAGVFQGLDGRVAGNGLMSGFLQTMSYISGLSGGSWLIGAIAVHDFATIDTMRSNYWHLHDNLLLPSKDLASFYEEINKHVEEKERAGFDTTITDYWAGALGRQLINGTDGGPETTFSSVANTTSFQSYDQPYPLIVIESRRPHEFIVNTNSTLFEISPYEFGTFDTRINLFIPTKYVGSNLNNCGSGNGRCVHRFDNAAFVLGTSSSLFNDIILKLPTKNISLPERLLETILRDFSKDEVDIAIYPNPFDGINGTANTASTYQNLSLVDGGEDGQNVPLWPILQHERNVDFIFAVDSSADTIPNNWPNGTSFVATYEKFMLNQTSDVVFPSIPDQQTFINLGLNSRPTFFGCNAQNFTGYPRTPPLVVYFPHAPWTSYTNFSTFKLKYSDADVEAFIENGVATVAQGNSTTWPICLACAVLQRSKERAGIDIGAQCQQCFDQYCWDGTINTASNYTYDPVLKSDGENFNETGMGGERNFGTKSVYISKLATCIMVILVAYFLG